ncbi:MAG: DUF5320 domain-containing protein [Candidatus Diapherotrites archaeon]|nr:DUF5320 domain-containing protein [Candidatus Diapherotrites archaeon]
MPAGDGTGPLGLGPMTGRAMGYCAGYSVPGYMNPGFGFYGRRFGRGLGFGRGFAWRRYWFARRFAVPVARIWQPIASYPIEQPTRDVQETDELKILEEEAKAIEQEQKALQQELEAIRKRIEELKRGRQ